MPNSYVQYTADGATTDYSVPFLFLSRSHVHILVGGAEVTTGFTWVSDSLIRFSPAVASTVTILFKRVTPISSRLVEFQNGSTLNAVKNLDYDSDQLLFLIQELTDLAVDLGVAGGGGSHSLFGTSDPANLLGVDGDVYFNITTNGLWLKASGAWVFKMFVGAVGTAGGDLSGSYPNPTLATLALARVNVTGLLSTANTPGLGGVIQKTAGSATTTFTAGAVDTTALADANVTTAKLAASATSNDKLAQVADKTVKANVSGGTANPQDVGFAAFGAAITPYLPESLAMMNETPAPTVNINRYGILVDVPGQGQVSLNTVTTTLTGALGWFNWATYAWSEVTISGVSGITYATAIYVPVTGMIWAANSSGVVHIINPTTGVATLSSLTLYQFVYNALDSKVYGYVNGSGVVKQIDPSTQVVLATVTDAGSTAGFSILGIDATSGMLYLWRNNTGGGNFVVEIDTTTFTSVARSTSAPGASNAGNQNDRIAVCRSAGKVFVASSGFNFGVLVDTVAHTAFVWKGRFLNGSYPAVNPTTGYVYIAYLSNCFWVGKLDPTTSFFDTIAVTPLASVNSAAQVKSACWTSDGHFVVQTNVGSYIRIYP